MSRATGFAARSLISAVVFGVVLVLIRLGRARPAAPLAGLIAVAIVAGVLRQIFRWKRGRYTTHVSVEEVRLVSGVAAIIWVAGLWVDVRSADRGALVIGGTIGAAVVIYTYSFLPYHRAV